MHLHLSVVYFSLFVTIIAGPFPQQTDLNADLDFNEANLNTEISDNPYQDPGTSGNYDQIASSGITDGSTIASQLATSNTGTDGNSLGAGDFSGASISTYYQSKLNMLVASSIRAKRRERGKNKQPQPQPQPQPQKAPSSNPPEFTDKQLEEMLNGLGNWIGNHGGSSEGEGADFSKIDLNQMYKAALAIAASVTSYTFTEAELVAALNTALPWILTVLAF